MVRDLTPQWHLLPLGGGNHTPFNDDDAYRPEPPSLMERTMVNKKRICGIEKLPIEVLDDIIILLHPIDLFALKLVGSHWLLDAVRYHCRLPFREYIQVMKDEISKRWPPYFKVKQPPTRPDWHGDHYYYEISALDLAAARGQASLVIALLDIAPRAFFPHISKHHNYHVKGGRVRRGFNTSGYPGKSVLHWAAEYGQDDVIRLLLKRGAHPSAPLGHRGLDAGAAIHLAVMNGHESTVRLLLQEGANISSGGLNALVLAAELGNHRMVTLLLDSGVRATSRDRRSRTAPCVAVKAQHHEVTSLFLDVKEGIHAPDGYLATPLHYAALLDYDRKTVCRLVEHGASINARDYKGRTPLLVAAQYLCIEAVITLLDYGSNIHSVDKEGNTALHLAARKYETEAYKVLKLRGAKSNVLNRARRTPLVHGSLSQTVPCNDYGEPEAGAYDVQAKQYYPFSRILEPHV